MRMEKILKQIAREHGVTVKEVREEMQKAITEAWTNPPGDGGVTAAHQRRVPCKGEIPTPEELIRYAAAEIRKTGRL
ncbi:MAG: terpene synthase/cyclase family protein [Lachnospiraceae bacterium]|nr:terpene synthase/cyclase family protein [Lachnospiraceae bacterium]